MTLPTPDQSPDIRLLLESLLNLIAASSPDGDMKIAVEPSNDSDIGIQMLVYTDNQAGPNGYKILVKDQKIKVLGIEGTAIDIDGTGANSIKGNSVALESLVGDLTLTDRILLEHQFR